MTLHQPLKNVLIGNILEYKEKYLKVIQKDGVVIYGTGQLAVKIYKLLISRKIKITGIVDHDPVLWGKELFGIKVKPINEIDRRSVVIVSIWAPNHSFRLTKKSLQQFGFDKILPPLSITFLFDNIGSIHYQIADLNLHNTDDQKIKDIINCIISDKSRELYRNYIQWRLSIDESYLELPKISPKYFLEDIFLTKEINFLIDGGSYDGDTLRDFLFCKGSDFNKIICFEPDKNNFHALSVFLESVNSEVSKKISIYQLGISENKKNAYFENSGELGSKIVKDKSDNLIELITIDSLNLDNLDFMKLDIEGSEMEALKGSTATIKKFHPALAISIYHNPRDFIDIPFFIHKQFNYSKFEIVQYDNDGIDLTVLATY